MRRSSRDKGDGSGSDRNTPRKTPPGKDDSKLPAISNAKGTNPSANNSTNANNFGSSGSAARKPSSRTSNRSNPKTGVPNLSMDKIPHAPADPPYIFSFTDAWNSAVKQAMFHAQCSARFKFRKHFYLTSIFLSS